jgi:hypothetical protein
VNALASANPERWLGILRTAFGGRHVPRADHRDPNAKPQSSSHRYFASRGLGEYLEALRYGAFDLIASPCQPNDVFWALKQIEREEQERAASLYPSQSSARPSGEATL